MKIYILWFVFEDGREFWLYYLNLDWRHSVHAHMLQMETEKFCMMHFYDLFFMKMYTLGKEKKTLHEIRYVVFVQKSSPSSSDGKGWKIKWKTWKCYSIYEKEMFPLFLSIVWPCVALIRVDNYRRNGHKAILAFQSIKCCWTEFSGIIESESNVHTYTQPNETKWNDTNHVQKKNEQKITTTPTKRNENTELEMRWVWCQGWHTHTRTHTRWHNINQELNNSADVRLP